jgi:hypothetical protein
MSDQEEYRSYLLRLWHTPGARGGAWRASLEDPHTGIRIGFSSVERLHTFLLDQTEREPQVRASPADPRSPAQPPADDSR